MSTIHAQTMTHGESVGSVRRSCDLHGEGGVCKKVYRRLHLIN